MPLYHLNTDKERHTCKMYTDRGSSNVACEYCCLLSQEDEDVVIKRIVGFYSRKKWLMPKWKGGIVCSGVLFTLNKMEKYVSGKEFLLMTANTTAMIWLLRKSECSSTLHRWIACKQEFVE